MYKTPLSNIEGIDVKRIERELLTSKNKSLDKKKLKKACEDFEALFIEKLWKEMKKTIGSDGLLNDPIDNQYLDMFDYDFAKKLSEDGGGIGLSKYLYNNLVEQLEQKSEHVLITNIHKEVLVNQSFHKKPDIKPLETTPLQEHGYYHEKNTRENSHRETQEELNKVNKIAERIEKTYSKNKEKFILPLRGIISSRFGYRRDPFFGDIRWHNGIDIAAPEGTKIRAATGGEVVFSGKKHGYGNVVIIKDSHGIETIYAHNRENLVKVGEKVKPGDVIAKVGETGRSTGPHLHFEVRINNKPVDPMNYISPSMFAKRNRTNVS